MRKLFFNVLGCAVAALSLIATSCTPDKGGDTQLPNFPTAVTAEVEAGSTYTLSIKPNMAWSVSIPDEAVAYFSILDGDAEVYSVNGEAGSYEVVIKVTDIRDYNASHVCEVKMTMGDREQTVATLTLGQVIRSIEIYDVLFEDNGDWMYGAQTMYEYSDEQVGTEGVTLKWGENGLDMFCHRIKIVSNFNWKIDGTPAWIQAINNNTEDVTELWIKGDAANYPMEDATATLSFLDADDNTIDVVATLKVSITSAKEIFEFEDFDNETTFNHLGELYNANSDSFMESNADGYVNSLNETLYTYTLSFNELVGMKQPTFNHEWINCTIDEWDTTEEALIQPRYLSIGVSQNESDAREAMVIILPQSIVNTLDDASAPYEILDESMSQLRPEYEKYVVTTIKQLAHPGPIANTASNVETILWKKLGADGDVAMDYPDAAHGYELLYTDKWDGTNSSFTFDGTYTSIEYSYINDEGNKVVMSSSESWLQVLPNSNGTFQLYMTPKDSTPKHWKSESYYKDAYWSYVVFKNGSEIAAVISCLYNLGYDFKAELPTVEASIAFSYPQLAASDGSTLTQLTSGEEYNKVVGNFGEIPVWQLTYTTSDAIQSALSGINPEWSVNYFDSEDRSWLSFEPGEMATVKMAAEGNGKSGILIFKDSNNIPQLALVCTLNIAQ